MRVIGRIGRINQITEIIMTALLLPRRRAHILPGEWEKIDWWSQTDPNADTAFIREWEDAVAAFVRLPAAAAVNSGRAGMTLILKHLGIATGDEVIVPAYTLKDLVPIIQALGANVVPADIDPKTLNVTAGTVAARMTPRTKAVIVLHAFGAPAPMPEILEQTDRAGIPVIEDCAHALGATLFGKHVGSFGYAAFYSFEMTKPVNTYGGGMVVSRNTTLIDAIRMEEEKKDFDLSGMMQKVAATRREMTLMNTGLALLPLMLMTSKTTKAVISAAYRRSQHVPAASVRYSPVQARLGLEKLSGLTGRITHRQRIAALYADALPPSVELQRVIDGTSPTWYFCVARLPAAAAPVRARMLLRGVDAAVEDEIADDCASLLGCDDCPNAASAFVRTVALPMFDDASETMAKRVANALNAVRGVGLK